MIALLTTAVAASVFGACAAFNVVGSRDADFGTASHRITVRGSDPGTLSRYVEAAETSFGIVDVIPHRTLPVPGSTRTVDLRSQDPSGAYGASMLALRRGRLPANTQEIALTGDAASDLDVEIGGEVPLDGGTKRVVGIIENPADLNDEFGLTRPVLEHPESVTILVNASEAAVESFSPPGDLGIAIESRGDDESTTAAVVAFVVSTVAMLFVSLIAAAGFVTLAQRRLRQLGMFAAVGATNRQLRLVMITNGAAVGVVSALIGTTTAALAWIAFAPTFSNAAGHRVDRLGIPLWILAAGLLLAIVTAIAAAWWPARSVARISVVRALSGRPPRPQRAHRSALFGGCLLVAGVVCVSAGIDPSEDGEATPLLIPGLLALVLAVLFLAVPAIRALARLARRLPVASRLAVRDLARYQSRSGAALGAISVALAISIAIVAVSGAAEPGADEGNLADRDLIVWLGNEFAVPERTAAQVAGLRRTVDDLARDLGGAEVLTLDLAVDPTSSQTQAGEAVRAPVSVGRPVGPQTRRFSGLAFVASPELLSNLEVDPATIGAATMLLTYLRGDAYLIGDKPSRLIWTNPVPDDAVQRIDAPAYTSLPRSLVTESGLRAGGWQPATAGWLVHAPRAITDAQLRDARRAAAALGLSIESRDQQTGLATLRTAATIAGVLLALAILAMTIGLLRSESTRDMRALSAAGATTRTRRALSATTAAALAGLGALLAGVSAYAALLAGYWPDTERLGNVPVPQLLVIAVGLPVLAAGAGWLLAGREPIDVGRTLLE